MYALTRARRVELVCLVAVGCIALKLVWDVARVHDLQFDDETLYMASGVRVFHPGYPNGADGLPAPDWGPLYCWWYALLHLFVRDTVRLYFFNWSALVALGSVAFYALSRAFGASAPASLIGAFVLTTSDFFEVWPYPSHFVTLLLCAGLVLAMRARTPARSLSLSAASLLLCCWVRPEFAIPAALVGAYALWRGARSLRAGTLGARDVLASIAPVVLGVGLAFAMGNPLSRSRAFYAWGQHYAFNQVQAERVTVSPWRTWLSFVRRDFGDVRSVSGALRANPVAFLRNVAANADGTPIEASRAIAPALFLPDRIRPTVRDIQASLVFLGFALALGPLWRRRREVVVAVLAVIAGTIASCLGVYPRSHYLVPIVAVAVCLATTRLPRIRGVSGSTRFAAAIAALLVIVAPNRAHGWCPQAALGARPQKSALEGQRTVAVLRALPLSRHSHILEPGWGYAFYAGYDYAPIEEWSADEGFVDFVRRRGIAAVILNDAFALDPRFAGDPQYQALLRNPSAFGFRAIEVPGTTTRLAVKEEEGQ